MNRTIKFAAITVTAAALLGTPAVLAQGQTDQPQAQPPAVDREEMGDREQMMQGMEGMEGMMGMMRMMSQMSDMMETCNEMMQAMADEDEPAQGGTQRDGG